MKNMSIKFKTMLLLISTIFIISTILLFININNNKNINNYVVKLFEDTQYLNKNNELDGFISLIYNIKKEQDSNLTKKDNFIFNIINKEYEKNRNVLYEEDFKNKIASNLELKKYIKNEVDKEILKIKNKVDVEFNNSISTSIISSIVLFLFFSLFIFIVFDILIKKPLNSFEIKFKEFIEFITMKQNKYIQFNVKINDEIGSLLTLLNNTSIEFDKRQKDDIKLMGEIVLSMDRLKNGNFKGFIKSESLNPTIMTLRKNINVMLLKLSDNIQLIEQTLNYYKNDDYSKKITIDKLINSELLSVMNSVNSLGNNMVSNVKTNLNNGNNLLKNSNILSESMIHLSFKANEQAASLEEAAASIEEITSITRNNTEITSKMFKLSESVSNSTKKGNQLALNTSTSMDEINEKVQSINEAITIIDKIAFQTNILSLNAAVEAATAGESGKGFAVVASEVRNLANRSADAAREIKKLVEDATIKSNEGKLISLEMIKGYEELNKNVDETIKLIEIVTTSSKEQMLGIEQINETINMLDQVTQENANESNQTLLIANELNLLSKNIISDVKNKKI